MRGKRLRWVRDSGFRTALRLAHYAGFRWATGMLGKILLGGVPLATCVTVLSSATGCGLAPSTLSI